LLPQDDPVFFVDSLIKAVENSDKCFEKEASMAEPERITPQETHGKLEAGAALLVCAYDSDEKFKTMPLEGAISLSAFQSRLTSLPKDQEIIFYCA
jgi:hypothetical protein